MFLLEFFFWPFLSHDFMAYALIGSGLLALSAGPVGCFLLQRRLALAGDAIAHSILPGVAIAYGLFGLSLPALALGGFAAGLAMAICAWLLTRWSVLREDTSFASLHLASLASGVCILSVTAPSVDLESLLFGQTLGLNTAEIALIASVAGTTLLALLLFWHGFVGVWTDPVFFRTVSSLSPLIHITFLILLVGNMVAGFQAVGALLSVGLVALPAASAGCWTHRIGLQCLFAGSIGALACFVGLLLSFHWNLPAGPSIILSAFASLAFSFLFGRGGMRYRTQPHPHL